jgi:hypothetical protein
LAVAFRRGTALSLTPITLALEADTPLRLGTTVEFERDAEILEGPSLVFTREGMVRSDEGGARGGWLLVWRERSAEGSALMLARIAAADTRLIGVSRLETSAAAMLPFAFLDADERVRIGFVSSDPPPNLYTGEVRCGPAP